MAAGGSRPEVAAVMVSMEEKLHRVISWLKKVFESQALPPFKKSRQAIDLLYVLAEYSEERERDAAVLIEDMKERAAEYDAEAEYLQSILTETLDLSPSALSEEGSAHLKTLVDSAMILETKDTSLTSYFYAISERNWELLVAETKNKELEQKLLNVKNKLSATLKLENQLRMDLKKEEADLEVEEAKFNTKLQDLQFLKGKSEDIISRIKTAEEQLVAAGFHESLMHESLVNLSKELAEVQEETVQAKKKLEYYLDLPPSLPLAQVMVEEAKRELNALEEELSKRIEEMTNNFKEMERL
ncbi:HAUS augmin-like complex subunit 1 [Excalfactoria chinensis]|uniref:HAUS augmin-like complex subunit 1 n=1 Tax=Excalfactoria chinensis TaxID=46218 RepID=UPI003B3AB83A